MINTMYLQKDYNGTYALSIANPYKNDNILGATDYILVMGNIDKDMTIQALNQLIIEKFGCEKLVIQF